MTLHKRTFGVVEVAFDLSYLATVTVMGIAILLTAQSLWRTLYGVMALVLVCGDAFHLAPRILSALGMVWGGEETALGRGKQITSVGMTLFYLLLWQVGVLCFRPEWAPAGTVLALLLGTARIVLCLLPQNRWGEGSADPRWDLWRNLPFLLLGLQVGMLFFLHRGAAGPFGDMWMAILLSFAFYVPVVLWAKRYPMVGMLMLPKSCAYIWIVAMGL